MSDYWELDRLERAVEALNTIGGRLERMEKNIELFVTNPSVAAIPAYMSEVNDSIRRMNDRLNAVSSRVKRLGEADERKD